MRRSRRPATPRPTGQPPPSDGIGSRAARRAWEFGWPQHRESAMSDVALRPAGSDGGLSRRRFIGYLIAAPTLLAGAELMSPATARAALPTVQPVDAYDLSDLLTEAAAPT